MAKVTELVAQLARPLAAEAGCTVWDTEYVKEGGTWFLRVYIDKEGGVSIDDCEAVSRPLSDKLDELDPIQGSYVLEVSSAGADRALKTAQQLGQFLGSEVECRLYRPRDGRRSFVGILAEYTQDGGVTLDSEGTRFTFEKKELAQVRLYVRV